MGREALARAEAGSEAGQVRALLEARELILRGDIRRRFALDAMSDIRVEGQALCFTVGAETVRLSLGAALAAKWTKAMTTPPPSLARRLGLDGGRTAWVQTPVDDPALATALKGATSDEDWAHMALAVVESEAVLTAVLCAHAARPEIPLWLVYPKGAAAFGDAAVRARLRAAGYRDSKSCAVSDRLTATRYALPKV